MSKTPRQTALTLLALHGLLLLYSGSDVASKAAAGTEFLSPAFCLFYGAVLVLLALYALGWQQVIKHLPLTTAYANRAITIVWGIFWGCVLFGEQVTWGKVVGAAIIICGIVLFVKADQESQHQTADAGRAGDDEAPKPASGEPPAKRGGAK